MSKKIEVEFKSLPDNYQPEKRGFKPNTIRKVNMSDVRFQELARRKLVNDLGKITIINARASCHHFTRRITDVTFFDEWVIISWEHVEV